MGTADGWSWDVEHVSWAEHEGAYHELGFEPWAEQWAAGPGSFASEGTLTPATAFSVSDISSIHSNQG